MNISVIVPTIGRSTLAACIDSFVNDLAPNDQVIVLYDHAGPYDEGFYGHYEHHYPEVTWVFHYASTKHGCFGHPLRNYALDRFVENNWVWSIDDDDEALPGALTTMRRHIEIYSHDKWFLFKIRFGQGHPARGHVAWQFPQVRLGNIGTPMIVTQPTEARWGTSPNETVGDGYFGDFEYAEHLHRELGEPRWCEPIIAEIRP